MRLINAATLKLEEFIGHEIPEYAILSHTWGRDEVSFQDMQTAQVVHKQGYAKIQQSCQRAILDDLQYVWVDTCCIDKTSSAELSEAINSMMRWYERSEVCYAYLEDVPPPPYGLPLSDFDTSLSAFSESRWFTRGWTLQELLAPAKLEFLAQDWSFLFSREMMSDHISQITGIRALFLEARERDGDLRGKLNSASIAERMSWASARETSRMEDMAYSLLGIFGINMPLLYGEGEDAFLRLQEEIMRHSDDQSLLAWNWDGIESEYAIEGADSELKAPLVSVDDAIKMHRTCDLTSTGVLATHPSAFIQSGDFVPVDVGKSTPPFSMTNKGLSMNVPLLTHDNCSFVLLQCQPKEDPTMLLAIPVTPIRDNIYARVSGEMCLAGHRAWLEWPRTQLYLLPSSDFTSNTIGRLDFTVVVKSVPQNFDIVEVLPFRPSREPRSNVLVNSYNVRTIRSDDRDIFVRFENGDDDCKSFILGFRVMETFTWSLSKERPKWEDYMTPCQFLSLEDSEDVSLEDLKLWLHGTLQDTATEEACVPYSAKITQESLFGQSLFSIDIIANDDDGQEQNENGSSLKGIFSLTHLIFKGHPRVQRVYERWFNTLIALSNRYLPAIFRLLLLSPWIFTFIIELPLKVSSSLRAPLMKYFLKNKATAIIFISAAHMLLADVPVQRIIRSWATTYLPSMHIRTMKKLFFLFIFCKWLPPDFLLAMNREEER